MVQTPLFQGADIRRQLAQPGSDVTPARLDYAAVSPSSKGSLFGFVALVMACVTAVWLGIPYLYWAGKVPWTYYDQHGGPLGETLEATGLWPVAITAVVAIVGLLQPRRRRWPSVVALAIIVWACFGLTPGIYR